MDARPRPRLIVFDLGGVLVRLVSGWKDACDRLGLAPPAGDFAAHHPLMQAFETGALAEEDYFDQACACFPGLGADDLRNIFGAWLLGPFPGAAELIDDLRARGLRTACLSNTNVRHWRSLAAGDPAYAFLARLDWRFASHELRAAKPHPEAYRHVERVTGHAGDGVLFFDDRRENVDAAVALGWQAEQIDPSRDGVRQVVEYLRGIKIL